MYSSPMLHAGYELSAIIFPGADEIPEDPFWKLAAHPRDIILRRDSIHVFRLHIWIYQANQMSSQ